MEIIKFTTTPHEDMVDITDQVQDFIKTNRPKDGFITLQATEKSLGVVLGDRDDPKFSKDYLTKLNKLMPKYDGMQFMGFTTASIKASFVSQSLSVIISNGSLVLGLHQGILAVDFASTDKEQFLFINYTGTNLDENESPAINPLLAELNDAAAAKELAIKEEEQRLIEEMRREYAQNHSTISGNKDFISE